jgi:hypothetical protein
MNHVFFLQKTKDYTILYKFLNEIVIPCTRLTESYIGNVAMICLGLFAMIDKVDTQKYKLNLIAV